jgi:hypothetical protein
MLHHLKNLSHGQETAYRENSYGIEIWRCIRWVMKTPGYSGFSAIVMQYMMLDRMADFMNVRRNVVAEHPLPHFGQGQLDAFDLPLHIMVPRSLLMEVRVLAPMIPASLDLLTFAGLSLLHMTNNTVHIFEIFSNSSCLASS